MPTGPRGPTWPRGKPPPATNSKQQLVVTSPHGSAGMDRGEANESVYSLIGFSVREIRPHLSAGRQAARQFAKVLAVRASSVVHLSILPRRYHRQFPYQRNYARNSLCQQNRYPMHKASSGQVRDNRDSSANCCIPNPDRPTRRP